ncbi:hypothetical protein GEV33_001748 [Tenebrio molitor]|uniref:Endonuclease/exonuclease/phosphatase domain-containing protein n=1 Tax=Tenebrio molitor TaxID=7067 RepID=A0A8J6HUQ3_TENMO|nr:hypothetical protein GEV33_001748 [Tenebrio molitor]
MEHQVATPCLSHAMFDNLVDTVEEANEEETFNPYSFVEPEYPEDHLKLTTTLRNTIGSQYTIKYTKHNTNIYTRNKSDWTKLQEVLKNDSVDFHTHTHKTDSFVLRGLHQGNAKKEKYVPAPLPKENAWEKRKKNTGSERAEPNYTEREHSAATPSTESVRTNTQSTQPIESSQAVTAAYNRPENKFTKTDQKKIFERNRKLIVGDFNAKHGDWNRGRSSANGILLKKYTDDNDPTLNYTDEPTHYPENGMSPPQ